MTKHYNAQDVEKAFARYVELTGDREARLERDGAYWKVRAGGDYCIRGLEAYGSFAMWALLHRYCDGYEDGRRACDREPIEAQRITLPIEERLAPST